jgi:hypothetical protein
MHQAPAVRVAVGRSRWHLGCIACGSGIGAAGALAFAWVAAQADWRVLVIPVAVLLASLVALQGWLRSPTGHVAWDGRHWLWSDAAGIRELQLIHCLDWQRCLLVRLDGDNARPLWLWLQPGSRADTTWLPLRRAIVSSLVGGVETARAVRAGAGERAA